MQHILASHTPDLKHYEELYRDLNSNPQLSCQEARTSFIAADHLERTGFKGHRNIRGHRVAGTFENGAGQTVLLRANVDTLTVLEETGVPYTSRKRMKDSDGVERPVMHACGQDTHVVSLLAAAELLISAKATWTGTLICVLQPNEEFGGGAQAMVDDGLYYKVPKPNVLLGQHVIPMKSGTLASRPSPTLSEASKLNVRIHGRGVHGSRPQTCIDPIVIAAYILVRLQSTVSREVNPEENVVVTYGSINGG